MDSKANNSTLRTYQDYMSVDEGQRPSFILSAIQGFKASKDFQRALEAQDYDRRKNRAILSRTSLLKAGTSGRLNVMFHKLCNGFFPKFVRQLCFYLLGNGVTIEQNKKDKLGKKFDYIMQEIGLAALVDGVCWGYWDGQSVVPFRIAGNGGLNGFFVLLDERTSDPVVGIRFFQMDVSRAMYVELYETDGVTEYKVTGTEKDKRLEIYRDKRAYKVIMHKDKVSEGVIATENYGMLPIFPLYANEFQQSELSDGFKSLIDAYDFISSDLADGITQIEGVYWTLRNYGGEDVKTLIDEIKTLKATATDGDNAGVDNHVIEIPYQAKQMAFELLRKQMYSDFMALDMDALQGGSLTNVAINVAKTDLDLKADIFESKVADFVENVMTIAGLGDVEVAFKRRSITNDTEMINNIYMMAGDLSLYDRLRLNPLIADQDLDKVVGRTEQEATSRIIDVPEEPESVPPTE